MTTTVQHDNRTVDTPQPGVRVGNAYAQRHPDGSISVVAINQDACLRHLTPATASDIYTALGLLGVTR